MNPAALRLSVDSHMAHTNGTGDSPHGINESISKPKGLQESPNSTIPKADLASTLKRKKKGNSPDRGAGLISLIPLQDPSAQVTPPLKDSGRRQVSGRLALANQQYTFNEERPSVTADADSPSPQNKRPAARYTSIHESIRVD